VKKQHRKERCTSGCHPNRRRKISGNKLFEIP
jgi:hypothetical protein